MYGTQHNIGGQYFGQPLDLPPPAEVDVVSQSATTIRLRRCFRGGIFAQPCNEFGRRRGLGRVGDIGENLHAPQCHARVSAPFTTLVNLSLGLFRRTLACALRTWHSAAMATPPRTAGGSLIALGAILGTVIGFPFQQTTGGLLAGLGVGVAAAVMIWFRERKRH